MSRSRRITSSPSIPPRRMSRTMPPPVDLAARSRAPPPRRRREDTSYPSSGIPPRTAAAGWDHLPRSRGFASDAFPALPARSAHAAHLRSRPVRRRDSGAVLVLPDRETHDEDDAPLLVRANPDLPAVLLDDLVGHGQPEPASRGFAPSQTERKAARGSLRAAAPRRWRSRPAPSLRRPSFARGSAAPRASRRRRSSGCSDRTCLTRSPSSSIGGILLS